MENYVNPSIPKDQIGRFPKNVSFWNIHVRQSRPESKISNHAWIVFFNNERKMSLEVMPKHSTKWTFSHFEDGKCSQHRPQEAMQKKVPCERIFLLWTLQVSSTSFFIIFLSFSFFSRASDEAILPKNSKRSGRLSATN